MGDRPFFSRRIALRTAAAAGVFALVPAVGFAKTRVRRFYVESRFGQLHGYRAEPENGSDKPPLICLHQTPSSAKIFAGFIKVMGEDRTVIAFDTPGYGASDGPDGRITLEIYGETIAAALEDLGFGQKGSGQEGSGKVDVVGMLTGAMIGGELARSRPDLVRRLVLVQSLIMKEQERLALIAGLGGEVRDGWTTLGAEYYTTRLQSELTNLTSERTVDQAITDFTDSLVAGEDFRKGGMTALSYPAERLFREITQPTLVIKLNEERSIYAAGAADIIPDAELLHLPSYTRNTFRADPEGMATPIRAFLDASRPQQ